MTATWQSTTVTDFGSDATTHAANMPATVNAGDLLLATAAFDSSSTTITTPSGWTLLQAGFSADPVGGLYAKVAGGTEGGTTVDWATNNSQRGSVHVIRVTDWYGTLDGLRWALGYANDWIGLSIGGTAQDLLWVAIEYKSSGSAWNAGPPSGYSNNTKSGVGEDTTVSASIATATKAASAASENITTLWNSSTAATFQTLIVAIYPGVPTATAAITLPHPIVMSASGVEEPTGTSAITLPHPIVMTASGTDALAAITATSTITLPHPIVMSASGTHAQSITGTSAITLPHPLVMGATGIEGGATGTSAITLPHPLAMVATGAALRQAQAYLVDRPTVSYDGSGLCNRVIIFGLDSDDSDLTLQFASPAVEPYPIVTDGTYWYVEDVDSIARYGLHEVKLYRPDIKSPYRPPPTPAGTTPGLPGNGTIPTAAAGTVFSLGSNPTNGQTVTIGGVAYTFKTTPTAAGDIRLGGDLFITTQNVGFAVNGADGINPPNPQVGGVYYNAQLHLISRETGPAGNAVAVDGGTSGATFDGGSTGNLTGGQYAIATANVLYALAVNLLYQGKSEVLNLRGQLANGTDVWALPGDRMRVTHRGYAKTAEGDSLGLNRFVWIDIDGPMLIAERHDKSDPSGVRQVEMVWSCPVVQIPVPAIPGWTDPVALPVPNLTGDSPPTVEGGDGSGFFDPGSEDPGADPGEDPGEDPSQDPSPDGPPAAHVAKILDKLINRTGLPVKDCCPDTTMDVNSGEGMTPGDATPQQWLAVYAYDYGEDPGAMDPHTAMFVAALGSDGGPAPMIAGSDVDITDLATFSAEDGIDPGPHQLDSFASWVVVASGDHPSFEVSGAGSTIAYGKVISSRPINSITIEFDSDSATGSSVAPPNPGVPTPIDLIRSATVTTGAGEAIFTFSAESATVGAEVPTLSTSVIQFDGTDHDNDDLRTRMFANLGTTHMSSLATSHYQPIAGHPGREHFAYGFIVAVRLVLNS